MPRVEIKPDLLTWARARAGTRAAELDRRFPQLPAWIAGQSHPTLRQLDAFAKAASVPVGYLFLAQPPVERVPIPDFRTIGSTYAPNPSPELLDTVYLCQQRQEWYRDYARSMAEPELAFVGSLRITEPITTAARAIREALSFGLEQRRRLRTWTDALRLFISQADATGVLVMASGVVANNTRRPLDPQEFRGFALADRWAPLVFINGADTKAAQIFTLAHELAHLWLGETALSDAGPASTPNQEVEQWCNQVAAEILVPLSVFERECQGGIDVQALARLFKVSTLVILRRLRDSGRLSREQFWAAYNAELERLQAIAPAGGGNFYLTQAVRASPRFARALVASTLEGHTLHRDAFRLLGFSKLATFNELGRRLGVAS